MIHVIGEAPSRFMAERGIDIPLVLAKQELAQLAGISLMEFDNKFLCHNLLDRWPGSNQFGKGDAWPERLARIGAAGLKQRLSLEARVILLGRRVEKAWGLPEGPFFVPRGNITVVPHPSRVSRWWNEVGNRQMARAFWRCTAKT